MNIKDAIKLYCISKPNTGFCIPTDELGYWNLNVVFFNNNKMEDETQFDIKPSHFDYEIGKCVELVDLWENFCKENSFKQNSVLSMSIVGGW